MSSYVRRARSPRDWYVQVPVELIHDDVVTPLALLLWLKLDDLAKNQRVALPTRADLAGLIDSSVDTLDRCVKILTEAGWLTVDKAPGKPSEYILEALKGGRTVAAPISEEGPHGCGEKAAQVRSSDELVLPIEKEKKTPTVSARDRATRVPEPFLIDDAMIEWAKAQAVDSRAALERITESFVDYWRGIPGAKGRKTDWPATWRNWVRRDLDNARGTGRSGTVRRSAVAAGSDPGQHPRSGVIDPAEWFGQGAAGIATGPRQEGLPI